MAQPALVLVVDDEPDMLWAIDRILDHTCFAVTTAGDAREALEHTQRRHFELAFIDVKLPDMDGMELAVMIKQRIPEIAIIMVSGYYYQEDQEIGKGLKRHQFVDFIAKPFRLHDVRAAATRALAESRLRWHQLT